MQNYTATLQGRIIILELKYLGKALAKLSYLGNIWMKLMKRHLISDVLLSNLTSKHLLKIQILHFCYLFKYSLPIPWFQCWNICSTLLGHKYCVKGILSSLNVYDIYRELEAFMWVVEDGWTPVQWQFLEYICSAMTKIDSELLQTCCLCVSAMFPLCVRREGLLLDDIVTEVFFSTHNLHLTYKGHNSAPNQQVQFIALCGNRCYN